MALQFTGNDVALVRDDATGKWDLQLSTSGPNKGNPVLDSTRMHAVLTSLVSWRRGTRTGSRTPEGGYYWDTTGKRGSLLWTVSQDRLATTSQLKAYADDAGQQLVNLKILASFTARATRLAPGRFVTTVSWTLPSGATPPPLAL